MIGYYYYFSVCVFHFSLRFPRVLHGDFLFVFLHGWYARQCPTCYHKYRKLSSKGRLPLNMHRNRFRGLRRKPFHLGGFGGFTPNVKARRCRPRTSSPPIPTRLRLRLSRCVVKGVPHQGAHLVSIGFNAHWEEPRGGFESRVLHNMSTGTPESRDIDVGNHQADGVGHLVHVDDLERCVVVVWTSRKQQRTT